MKMIVKYVMYINICKYYLSTSSKVIFDDLFSFTGFVVMVEDEGCTFKSLTSLLLIRFIILSDFPVVAATPLIT